MGKGIACFLRMCLISCVLAMTILANEGQETEQTASIEQIFLNMPWLTVYGYGLSTAGEPEAYLGSEKLQILSTSSFQKTGEGIDYYILLDISNSMPTAYFKNIKEGIRVFSSGLSKKDKACLITFGETVKMTADLHLNPDELSSILDTIQNTDNRTLLFEAISNVADMTGKDAFTGNKRRVVVVISDGEDVAEGKKMAQEALATLKEKAMPVYALCIKDTARSNINSFGEFARMSGGDILIFGQEESIEILTSLSGLLNSADILELEAGSNRISNQYEQLSLHFPEWQIPLNQEVLSCRFIADNEPLQILEVHQLEGRQMKLRFGKPVNGDETASNYIVRRGETVVPIAAVAHLEAEENTVILTAAEPFEEGTYTVSCVNITDLSQEKHLVEEAYTITLHASEPPVSEPEQAVTAQAADMTGLAGIILMAFAVIFITILVVYKKMKANGGVVVVDGEPVMASEIEVRKHVAIKPAEKKHFELLVTIAGKNPHKLELSMEQSMMVGRSNICDLFFDDKRMSRQHFALEWDGQNMYITDLETTNGTAVNGIAIKKRRKLERGDRIMAGSEEFTINW